MKRNRVDAILDRLEQMDLEQLVVTDAIPIFYFISTWVDAGERLVALYLSRHRDCCFSVNNMFDLSPDPRVKIVRFPDTDPCLKMLAGCTDSTRPLGMDKSTPAYFLLSPMPVGCGTEHANASIYVNGARVAENEKEMEAMRCVPVISDKAMAEFKALLERGATEREISNQMGKVYQKLGADDLPLPPSVRFGANAIIGHYRPGSVALKKEDYTLLDVRCKKDSYCADMTRTFFRGEIVKEEYRRACELVLEAGRATEVIIEPDVRLCDIDVAARKVIGDAGYGDRFTHRLGHFIGLEVHDFEDVSGANQKTAMPGNIFSIEPEIYPEGNVGIRTKDLMLATETGCEILNFYDKDPEIV